MDANLGVGFSYEEVFEMCQAGQDKTEPWNRNISLNFISFQHWPDPASLGSRQAGGRDQKQVGHVQTVHRVHGLQPPPYHWDGGGRCWSWCHEKKVAVPSHGVSGVSEHGLHVRAVGGWGPDAEGQN